MRSRAGCVRIGRGLKKPAAAARRSSSLTIYCITKAASHSFWRSLRYQCYQFARDPDQGHGSAAARARGEGLACLRRGYLDALTDPIFGQATGMLRTSRDQLDQALEGRNAGFAKMLQLQGAR